jgi:hypothetical protein
MASRRTIVFLGAPTAKEAMRTWKADNISPAEEQTENVSSLRPFEIDPSHRTKGVTWRRLTDPIESLSQELAETTMEPQYPEDLFLERSLEIFTTEDLDDEEEMDIYNPIEYSDISLSQIPFLTGYDFDINEVTELEDLPPPHKVTEYTQKKFSIIVVITEISACQRVTTKYGKTIPLVKLIVADQTQSNLEIACWENMAMLTQSMRIDDIIYFRGILCMYVVNLDLGITEFRGVVSAATRRKSRATILYRCRRLSREDDILRPRLDLEDQQTRLVRRLRDWVVRRSWVRRDEPPPLDTQES